MVSCMSISNNNFSYTPPYILSTSGQLNIDTPESKNGLFVSGRAVFEKEVILNNGQDLVERLELIEQRLNIPSRDVKLEAKYERLRELAELYREELERCRTWEALKKED